MTTSLVEQLQKLVVPQTSVLRQDKSRASLLFDKKHAAEISREVFYQIGLDGFEELKSKSLLFAPFENTLFHVTSKEYERSVQDAVANDRLNKQIRKFFYILSPYLSLTCAHKALEWLINRYSVHEYNRDDFVMLILPYHETNIFVCALQLIKIKGSGDHLIWLKDVQRTGVPLSKNLLYTYAAKNPLFLKDIGEFMLQALNEQDQAYTINILFKFYCAAVTGALEYSNDINETHVNHIISVLLKGFKSTIPDFCAGTYIITAKLLTKVQLSEKILNRFVNNISHIPVDYLLMEAVLVLVVLYQTQTHFSEISFSAVKHLANKTETVKVLEKLNCANNFINPLLEPLLKGLIEYGILEVETSEIHAFLLTLLSDVKLEDLLVSKLISFILHSYEMQRKSISDNVYNWLVNIVSNIEIQYPVVFDKEANMLMKVQQGKKFTRKQKCFQKLIISCGNPQRNIGMFSKLYHPVPGIRKHTIKHFIKLYNDLKDKEKELLRNIIIEKMNDENPDVVSAALYHSKKISFQISEKPVLKTALISLLQKSSGPEWKKILYSTIEILCHTSDADDVAVFAAIFPFLLPLQESDMKIAMLILNSSYFKTCKFLQGLDIKSLNNSNNYEMFFDRVTNSFQSIQLDISKLLENLENEVIESQYVLPTKYVIILLLLTLAQKKVSTNTGCKILDVLVYNISNAKLCLTKTECSLKSNLLAVKQNKFSVQSFLDCINILIERTDFSSDTFDLCDLADAGKETKFLIKVLGVLLTGCYSTKYGDMNPFPNAFKKFFNNFFRTFKSKLEFLFNVCIADTIEIDVTLRLRTLRTIHALVKENVKNTTINEIIMACLLISLSNKSKEIRICTITIITEILKYGKPESELDYSLFLNYILNYKEEITVDASQISSIMNNVLQNTTCRERIQPVVSKLVSLVNNANIPFYLRGYLTNILISIEDFEIYNKLTELGVELLEKNKDNVSPLNELASRCLYNMLIVLDTEKASKIQICSNSFQMLEMTVRSNSFIVTCDKSDVIPSILSITQIQNIFEYLVSDVRSAILNCVIEVSASTSNPDVVSASRKLFKHIDLDVNQINQQISEMFDVLQPKLNVSKRQRRISSIPSADVLETLQWKKGIVVFEFLQDKKKIRNSGLLIPLLFKILKKCLDFDEQSNVEYPKQLILSTLLNCCTKMEDTNLSENIFNVEVLVQCIRASQNPQTHHHALLVLAHAANFVPEQVLHHMIAIFTFMGSSVLRHDDAYSFQIINKIMDTIIPILIKDNSLNNIVNVLRVFVDAVLDVPEHRRITLYYNLIEKLGAKDNLNLFILLMLEAYVLHANVEKQKFKSPSLKNSLAPKRLDVAINITRKFSPNIIIENCIQLLTFLQKLPETKEQITHTNLPFDITHQTPKQYRHFKYAIITFVSNLLSSQEFVCIIANLSDEKQQKLETIYKDMIINTITYIQFVVKTADKNKNTSQSHYWKMILHHSYDVLDSVNRLLTPPMFLLVIRGLTTHRLNHIRRRSLELLNSKLQHDIKFFQHCTTSEIYEIVPALLNIIRQEASDENQLTIQTAFLSLKLFVRFFAEDHLEKLVNVLSFLTDFIKNTKIHGNILASAILCLSELCCHLRAYAIPNLNKFMPILLKIMKIHRQENQPDLLLLSTVTAILKILESLPLFLSSYIEKLLYELSLISNKWKNLDDGKMQPIAIKLLIIKEKVGTVLPFRVLLPAISKTYYQLIEDANYSTVGALTDILSQKISHLSSSELKSNLGELTTLFFNMLSFRASGLTSLLETNEIEKHIVDAANAFILKLSESAFRPLYYKIYDWAVRHDVQNERMITFYALSSIISENLKSLFVLFAGHILNNAGLLLNLCNISKETKLYYEDEEKTILLLEYVLKTLRSIFLYDTRKFIDKERFDVLMQPIVDQLENKLGNESRFIARTENLVIPCIVQFAVATGDDALWKQLNYQILLKMRHPCSTIRILTLKCILQLAMKLGADFLPLLPETIPFLAELLEDESEEVERTCQKTVQELEKILGEPLQKYF